MSRYLCNRETVQDRSGYANIRMTASRRPRHRVMLRSSAGLAERDVGVVLHDHVGAVFEREGLAVEAHDLEQAHAVAHRALRVVMDAEAVGTGGGRALDLEALGAKAGGHVGVELAARLEGLVRVEGMAAGGVADV